MSEEKKNLTEEERKELKEGLKKKIDEMSDEELDKVAGGYTDHRNPYQEQRFVFTEEELIKLYNGICPKCSQKIDKTKILEHVKNCGL